MSTLTHHPTHRGIVRPLSVAPMMDRTDRHFRVFLRGLTRHTLLYTEMVTTGAILHGDRDRFLGFDPVERPLALQLGGDAPADLAACARFAADMGYDEVNLNVGCPSDRVQRGRIGACLMAEPDTVARAVEAMRNAVDLPVTVKHRIGIDHLDRYEDMLHFVDTVTAAGADRFSVHARIAWLQGLSPKENRQIPPLRYADVHRLKAERPGLVIEINGGIKTLDEVAGHLDTAGPSKHGDPSTHGVDAVMIGRAAWDDPWIFADADRRFFSTDNPVPTRRQALEAFLPYLEARCAVGDRPHHVAKGIFNLFNRQPGSRAYRRHLSEHLHRPGAGPQTVLEALNLLPEATDDGMKESRTVHHASPVAVPVQ